MAATMATIAASSAIAAVASAPAVTSSASFRGQRLVAGRGVSVAVRRSVVVRAEDVSVLSTVLVDQGCITSGTTLMIALSSSFLDLRLSEVRLV